MSEPVVVAPRRCGIYTRKSTSSRLDQEVNSLTTQHEICSAYISSQRYRGWMALPERYDDGGHSGSGIERPALAALMHDKCAATFEIVRATNVACGEMAPNRQPSTELERQPDS